MTTKSGSKGWRWEHACEVWLKAQSIFVHRRRSGGIDTGDLHDDHPASHLYGTAYQGVLGWTLQLKNWQRGSFGDGTLATWWSDANVQRKFGRAKYAALWVKREGIGKPGMSWAIMSIEEHLRVMLELHALRHKVANYRSIHGPLPGERPDSLEDFR